MYSGNRVCFTCGKGNCPGHPVEHVRNVDKPSVPSKLREDYELEIMLIDQEIAEIEGAEIECTRLLAARKIGPLEHWQWRNRLETLMASAVFRRRMAVSMANKALSDPAELLLAQIDSAKPRLGLADLKAREARA